LVFNHCADLVVIAVITASLANKTPSAPFRHVGFCENPQTEQVIRQTARHGKKRPFGVRVIPPPKGPLYYPFS